MAKYQALDNFQPAMDKYYSHIPNKYYQIMNLYDERYQLYNFEMNPSKYLSVKELYRINGTIPVEVLMNPAEDYDAFVINLAIDRDYRNITFLAKTRKMFKLQIFRFPDLYHISIEEKNELGQYNIIQQVLISRKDYVLTYLRPFNSRI